MTQSGWRKPTPGLLQAEKFAKVGEQKSVAKSRAMVAVKKVAVVLGLKAQEMLLLDTFGAVTQPHDWEEGRRPIVWPSNAFLMEHTGFSLSTLRRHIRRLCDVGVISMRDSPNGKRWGRRDAQGVIVEAYGFDLAPLAARVDAFEALHARLQADRAQCTALRNAITVARRTLRAKIDQALSCGLPGPWGALQADYTDLLSQRPERGEGAERLERFLDRLKALLTRVDSVLEQRFHASQPSRDKDLKTQEKFHKMTPRGTKDDTHIQTTKDLKSETSNCFETKPDVSGAQGCQSDRPEERQVPCPEKESGPPLDLPVLMAACPQFAGLAREAEGYLRTWSEVHRAAAKLRPMVGISDQAWSEANQVLGATQTAASVALIVEKTAQGEITSPGGYLRALVARHKVGELHLARSLHGRLSQAQAA